MQLLLVLLTITTLSAQPVFVEQRSGSDASLRGLAVVSGRVAWATGSKGTVLRTVDGGRRWESLTVPGAQELDFRDVHAESDTVAYILSAGPGDKSKFYRTVDGGRQWTLLLTNPDKGGFLDAMAFWDRDHGLIMGDPVNGQFVILRTSDGGKTWTRQKTPAALTDEGGFAGSGTCLVTGRKGEAWFASGGLGTARVFHSQDWGETWSVAATPVRKDAKSAGIFSVAFRGQLGIAVGGDFQRPEEEPGTAAVSHDGGLSWKLPAAGGAGGYRSGVAMAGKTLIAVGSHGVSFSRDGGEHWDKLGSVGYHAIAMKGGEGWAVGSEGRIARVRSK